MIPSPRSFLRFMLPRPSPLRQRPGTKTASRNKLRDPGLASARRRASECAAVVATLNVAVPRPPDTETGLIEQVTGEVTTGLTEQLRLTVEGLRPPDGLIVIVHCAEPPSCTVVGDSGAEDRLKFGALTVSFRALEVLPLKLLSPL